MAAMSSTLPRPPPKIVTLRLVMEASLTKRELVDYNAAGAEEALEKARALKTVHLDWQDIGEISGLEPFESAEVLYLQGNRISKIENLEALSRLQFLALQRNAIKVVENLLCLRQLEFLDLSKNLIEDLDERELPETINILNLLDNPCTQDPGYHARLRRRLPDLAHLDGQALEDVRLDATVLPARQFEEDLPQEALAPLGPGERGLAAYWRKDELQAGAANNVAELIEAYSMEALHDMEGFSRQVEGATSRSRARQSANALASVPSTPSEVRASEVHATAAASRLHLEAAP